MRKQLTFLGVGLGVLSICLSISANTKTTIGDTLLSYVEALADCEATLNCDDGDEIKCQANGVNSMCGSGTTVDGVKYVRCVSDYMENPSVTKCI